MEEWGMMNDESGESMEPMEEVPLIGLGESELEWLVRGWRREAGGWFHAETRGSKAYWKEQSVIRREDDVDGRVSVTKGDLRGGWTVMRLCRYEGERSLYLMCSVIFSQNRDRRMKVMWLDLGALTTARAREFWICWSRVIWELGRNWRRLRSGQKRWGVHRKWSRGFEQSEWC